MDGLIPIASAESRPRRPALRWVDTIVVSGAAAWVYFAHVGPPVQSWVIFCFMVLYPGMPYARLLRLPSLLIEVTLAIALSLALDVIVAEAMVYARHLSANVGMATLLIIALIGVGLQVRSWVSARDARGSMR